MSDTPRQAPHRPGRALLAGAVILAILALSFAGVIIQDLNQLGVSLLGVAFYRMLFSTILLGTGALVVRAKAPTRADAAILLVSGACLAAHFGFWTLSFAYIPVARSVLIVNSQPVFVLLASVLILGERPSPKAVAGVAIALVGMLVVSAETFAGSQTGTRLGDALALAGAITVVGYILAGRRARARLGLLSYVVPVYAVSSAVLLAWCLASGVPLSGYPARAWVDLALLALVPTLLGHTVFNWLIRYVPANIVSVSFLGESIGAAVLALALFGQQPSAFTLAAAPFILGGIALTLLSAKAEPLPDQQAPS